MCVVSAASKGLVLATLGPGGVSAMATASAAVVPCLCMCSGGGFGNEHDHGHGGRGWCHAVLARASAVPRCVVATMSGPRRRVCHGECERLGLGDGVWASARVHTRGAGDHAASATVGVVQV